MALPYQFGKHILDFISGKPLNSNEEEILAQQQMAQQPPSLLGNFLGRPTLESQGLAPQEELTATVPQVDPNAGEDYLDQVRGQPPGPNMFELNLPTSPNDINKDMNAAAQTRDDITLRNSISKAGKQIGQGLSGSHHPASSALNEVATEQAGNSIKDYMQKLSLAKHDPKSPQSIAFREFAKRFGVNINGDFTADAGEKLLPLIYKSFEGEENRKLKEELMKDQLDLKRQNKEDKATAQDDKDYMKLTEKINADTVRGNTAFGRNANIYRAANALETLANSYKNKNDLSTRQIEELAKGLDSMLSAGGGTVAGAKSLVPLSGMKDINKMMEYITNQRRGAGMKSFVNDIMDTVGREKQNAMDQMRTTQGHLLSGYAHLPKKNPTKFAEFLERQGIPADIMQPKQSKLPSNMQGEYAIPNVPSNGTIKVRRLQDGAVKTVEQSIGDQLLSDPSKFERVQ